MFGKDLGGGNRGSLKKYGGVYSEEKRRKESHDIETS